MRESGTIPWEYEKMRENRRESRKIQKSTGELGKNPRRFEGIQENLRESIGIRKSPRAFENNSRQFSTIRKEFEKKRLLKNLVDIKKILENPETFGIREK